MSATYSGCFPRFVTDPMPVFPPYHDLASPDGKLVRIDRTDPVHSIAEVLIDGIPPYFAGYDLPPTHMFFNIKSTLAQLGIDGIGLEYHLDRATFTAYVTVCLRAYGTLGKQLVQLLAPGAYIGKLFAADDRRIVRDPDYLTRMFGRSDRQGDPLLSLGSLQGGGCLVLEKQDGRTVAFLSLIDGVTTYDATMPGLLPTIAAALTRPGIKLRDLLQLHHIHQTHQPKVCEEDAILLVRTLPLHVRTVFARVVDTLLPPGVHHTSASVLEPDTRDSGDIYELFGTHTEEVCTIPLEFYTLEPFREYVFFADRDQMQECIEQPQALFDAFDTAPPHRHCATFVVKGEQLLHLTPRDWIATDPRQNEFPGLIHPTRQALMVERYILQQPSYPFLRAIEEGTITSQGILLLRYFPTPLMKRVLLSTNVQSCLKGIYFEHPSQRYGDFFSHEDRSLLHDLAKFAIPAFWIDRLSHTILQYVPKPEKDSGMFVPLNKVQDFIDATFFGIYGSNLIKGEFEEELQRLMQGVLDMQKHTAHPLLDSRTPLALVTGGGPGAMEVGNHVAKALGILSCANIVDFRHARQDPVINEQRQNIYIDAKMTYRIDRLVERQAEFHLDFPIFLPGGIGTDFEYALEEVRRKVSPSAPTPCLLLGSQQYWKNKITSRFQCNLLSGTIAGTEWIGNCFYCVQTARQGLEVYRKFFLGTLPIGQEGPIVQEGFVSANRSCDKVPPHKI